MPKEITRAFGSCGKISSSRWMNGVIECFKLIDLPDDVIVDILMRLPTKSLCCILCASKTFSNRVDDPLFGALHMSRLLLNSGMNSVAEEPHPPQLLLFSRAGGKELQLQPLKYNNHFDFAKPNYNLLVSKILTPHLYEVGFVYFNLFFFKGLKHNTPCFLLNPHKGEVLKIPAADGTGKDDFCYYNNDLYGMGFDTTTNTHKTKILLWIDIVNGTMTVAVMVPWTTVANMYFSHATVMVPLTIRFHNRRFPHKIVNVYFPDHRMATRVYVLGQSSCSWRQIQSVPPSRLYRYNMQVAWCAAYGDVHWLLGPRRADIGEGKSHIISFDIKKEEFYYTPDPPCESSFVGGEHLITLKGCMTLVRISLKKEIAEIWVMKDYIKKEWSLDYKICLQLMFVELSYDRFRDITCGEWKNGIFFDLYNDPLGPRLPSVYYFMDLQHNSIKRVEKLWSGVVNRMFSYNGSLLSLKGYGDSVQATKGSVSLNGCDDF